MRHLLKLAVLALVMTSCTNDDTITITEPTEFKTIAYNSQDNILKIDDSGDWLESMDWNTYVDEYEWQGANPYFGVKHNWDGTELRIVSEEYVITGAVIEDIYTEWYLEDGALYISVPTMHEYMSNSDMFYFTVEIKSE